MGKLRYDQYMICINRGHSSDPHAKVKYPKRQCKFCETIYWTEQREENVPTPPRAAQEKSNNEV